MQAFRYSIWVSGADTTNVQLYVATNQYRNNLLPPAPLASIFSDLAGTTSQSQPIAIGSGGVFTFCAAYGSYNFVVVQNGVMRGVAYDQIIGQSASAFSMSSYDGSLQIIGMNNAIGIGSLTAADIPNLPSGGGSGNSVQAIVDFGTSGPIEETTARTTVSAPWVTASSSLIGMVIEGQNHTADEVASEQVTATVGNIQAGVGFDVVLSSLNGSSGKFLVAIIGN